MLCTKSWDKTQKSKGVAMSQFNYREIREPASLIQQDEDCTARLKALEEMMTKERTL